MTRGRKGDDEYEWLGLALARVYHTLTRCFGATITLETLRFADRRSGLLRLLFVTCTASIGNRSGNSPDARVIGEQLG
jgi:hypothetical protein